MEEGLANLTIIYQTFLHKNVPLILEWALPLELSGSHGLGSRGVYKAWEQTKEGVLVEFWWGALGGSTAGQFRRIVVNKSVVKPSCDQLLSGDEGEGGDLECRGGQVFGAL